MRLADLERGLTYLDANVLIYAVEGYARFVAVLAELMDGIESGRFSVVTSELTLSEVLVGPLRQRDTVVAGIYRALIAETGPCRASPVDRAVLLRAAELRAAFGGKLPDAIHAATAELTGSARLLTGDAGLRTAPGLPVVLAQDLSP